MKKRVLITGVNGFIGNEFVQYVKQNQKGIELYSTDILQRKNLPRFTAVNLLKEKELKKLLLRVEPDYVFHFAGGRMANEKLLRQSNLETTDLLLKMILDLNLSSTRVVIPGSAAEYGLPSKEIRKISEKSLPKPKALYGQVKLKQTQMALGFAKKGVDVVVGRVFNITGSNTPDQLAAGRFAKQIVYLEKNGRKGKIKTMDLTGHRDFLDINDVCAALWQLAQYGRKGQIYNVCSGQSVSIEDLLIKMIEKSRLIDVEIDDQEDQKFKSFNIVGSNAKIKRETKWLSKIHLEDSLLNTLKSYRKMQI